MIEPMESAWSSEDLTRDEVEQLMSSERRWRVTYCWGSKMPPAAGRGPRLPAGVLEHVPTQAAKRKIQRGHSHKTYFRAHLDRDGDDEVLEFVER